MVLPLRCLLSHLILSIGSVSAELPSRRYVNMSNSLGELFEVWIMNGFSSRLLHQNAQGWLL